MKFEMYKAPPGGAIASLASLAQQGWRWRLRADNGEPIASGEGYKNKEDCLHAIGLVMDTSRKTPLVETGS